MAHALNAPATYETDEGEAGLYGPTNAPNLDVRSKLIRSKERFAGQIIPACPFKCREKQMDAQGYCKHLVGFTIPDSEPLMYEPFKERVDAKGKETGYRFTDGSDPRPVKKKDELVRITTSYRVYREEGEPVDTVGPLIEEKKEK